MTSSHSNNLQKLYEEKMSLEDQLQGTGVFSDPNSYRDLSKKYSQIQKRIELYEEIARYENTLTENDQLLQQEPDPEIQALLKEDITQTELKLKVSIDRLKELETPEEPYVAGNAIIEIRAGTGGDEAALFCQEMYRAYSKFAEKLGLRVDIASVSYAPAGGFKEIVFFVEGDYAYKNFRYESGVHRVQRVPVTESAGRIHTSAISVVVLPEIPEVEINIRPEEIRIDVYRSSGPGGQSVNTTDSAVRIVHLPTGIIVTCQDQKSQLKNKAKALKILQAKLFDIAQQQAQSELGSIRRDAIQTGDRSAKIRTYNFPQSRVTDHRSKHSWHNLSEIMEGEFNEITVDLQNFFAQTQQDKELS